MLQQPNVSLLDRHGALLFFTSRIVDRIPRSRGRKTPSLRANCSFLNLQ
jgi:hypothetical protein